MILHYAFGLTKPKLAPAKKKRLSLNLKKRFAKPVIEDEETLAAKGVTPANTDVANEWAVLNLMSWVDQRDLQSPDDPVPNNLLCCSEKVILCKWLCALFPIPIKYRRCFIWDVPLICPLTIL